MSLTQINKAGLDEIALDHVFTIGASGSSAYTFQGEGLNGTVNNPTLYLTRGKTYRFENGSGGHPIRIQSTSGASGTAYNTGVTNNAGSGTVIVEVQHDAPDVLYYQCTSHAAMNGILYITGALADGGVTTAKLADDAVTDAKLANSINAAIAANTAKTSNATHTGDVTGSTSLTIATNAVTTAKIADSAITNAKIASGAVGTNKLASGAVGSGEIAAGSIVNSNISSSAAIAGTKIAPDFGSQNIATTGTLASADITVDGSAGGTLTIGGSSAHTSKLVIADNGGTANGNLLIEGGDGSDFLTITSSGKVGIGTSTIRLAENLHVLGNGIVTSSAENTNMGMFGTFGGSDLLIGTFNNNNVVIRRGNSDAARFTAHGFIPNGTDTASVNAFSDYEEGSWTPTLTSGTATWYNQQWYTKIGRMVTCYFYMYAFSDTTSSTHVRINGLPFPCNFARESSFSVTTGGNPSLGSGSTGVFGRIGVTGTTTQITLYRGFNSSTSSLTYAQLGSGHYYATFSYPTDS